MSSSQQQAGYHHKHKSLKVRKDKKSSDVVPATPEEFLQSFRTRTSDALCNAYMSKHPIYRSNNGRLMTSLGAEIFTLFNALIDTLDTYLGTSGLANTDAGDALVIDVVEFLLLNLKYKQSHFRSRFLQGLESCCAASNDFWGMVETAEEVTSNVLNKYKLRTNRRSAKSMLRKKSRELIQLYSADAVYSAQMTHLYVFEPICESVERDLFGREWELNLTQNEVALSLVRTIEDFLGDIETFLADEFLAKKAVDSLLSATVIFYVRCLLLKAKQRQGHWKYKRTPIFKDTQRALARIDGDLQVMKDFFLELVPRMPALSRGIEKEFAVLIAVYECLCIGAGVSDSHLNDFVIVLHKFTRNLDVTRHVTGDLFLLVAPDKEHEARAVVTSMKKDLKGFADIEIRTGSSQRPPDRLQVPGLLLDDMLAELYDTHGLGGQLHKLSPKEMIDSVLLGGATREKPVILNDTESRNPTNSGMLASLQSLHETLTAHQRRGSF